MKPLICLHFLMLKGIKMFNHRIFYLIYTLILTAKDAKVAQRTQSISVFNNN